MTETCEEPEPAAPGKASTLWLAVAFATALGGFAGWAWNEGAEARALAKVSPAERGLLYQRELASLRTLCASAPPDEGLRARCQEKAQFLLEFPECGADCRQLAHAQQPRATK